MEERDREIIKRYHKYLIENPNRRHFFPNEGDLYNEDKFRWVVLAILSIRDEVYNEK